MLRLVDHTRCDARIVTVEMFLLAELSCKLVLKFLQLNTQQHVASCRLVSTNRCINSIAELKKTKDRFGRLLRPLARKRSGSILVSVLHRFVTYFT